MRTRHVLVALIALASCFGPSASSRAQDATTDSTRKLVRKVEPRYPELAKRMNLGGTVKVVAVVAADGNVKKVEPLGGSPLLVQAAQSAITQWKFVPGPETRETVELHFKP